MSDEIRQLGTQDVQDYRKIRLEALKRYPDAYGSTYIDALTKPIELFSGLIERANIFGVFVDEQLCGIACFMASTGAQDNHIGHLHQMFIRIENQNSGLGLKLIDVLVDFAKSRVKQIYLGVGTHNLNALALYKKAGFEIYGTEPRALLVNGKYINEHLMVKFLDTKEN